MNIIGFVVSLLFFVGGFYVMGSSFAVEGWEAVLFIGGILCCSLGLAIPAHIMRRIDG